MATQTASALSTRASVRTLTTEEEFAAIGSEWNSLLQASDADCFFLTFEWLATWWKHLGTDHKLAIQTVRQGDRLIAIAPFAIRSARPLEGRLLPSIEFLGSGFAGSDYLDIVARRGFEDIAIANLAAELKAKNAVSAFTLRLSNVRQPDSLASKLMTHLQSDGWHADEIGINVCPFVSLDGHTWDTFLSSLGSETRYNFNRKWKRLNRDFAVIFEEATAETLAESIALVIAQHNQRWSGRGGSDAFHMETLVSFHREISEVALKSGWLRLYILKLNGQPASSLYGFLYGGVFNFYQSGFDPAFEKHSVGFLAMGCAIQKAIAEGAHEYDLLHGDEGYKSHWTSQKRPIGRLEIHPPGIEGAASRGCLQMGRIYRNVARRVLRSTV